MMMIDCNCLENFVGKEENAGYQHFLLFAQGFQQAFSSHQNLGCVVKDVPLTMISGYITNQSQEYSLSFPNVLMNLNVIQLMIG